MERKKSSDAELLCGELIYSNRMLCVLVYVYTQYIYLFIFMCADSVTNIYIYIYIHPDGPCNIKAATLHTDDVT